MEDEGAELILDGVEAALRVHSVNRPEAKATFERVTGVPSSHIMIVHLEGLGRYQVEVLKEAS